MPPNQFQPPVLYIGNLPFEASHEDLAQLFSSAAGFIGAEVQLNDNGLSKGFGYAGFSSAEEAKKCLADLPKIEMNGRKLVVNLAKSSRSATEVFEDVTADAICAGAKAGWKMAKYSVPVAGRIAAKVVGKAAQPLLERWEQAGEVLKSPEFIAQQKKQNRLARNITVVMVVIGAFVLWLWISSLARSP